MPPAAPRSAPRRLQVAPVAAPLRHQVIDALRLAITQGELRPDDRLVERELCAWTGVSRTLVREALRQLEAEGLVLVVPNRGPVVRRIGREEAEQLYEVRGILEALACRRLAERGTEADRRRLRQQLDRMREAFASGAGRRMVQTKNDFYDLILARCGNAVAEQQLRQLHARISQLRATSLSLPGRASESLREIEALVAAIESGDGAAAWDAALHHVERAAAAAVAALDRPAERPPSP